MQLSMREETALFCEAPGAGAPPATLRFERGRYRLATASLGHLSSASDRLGQHRVVRTYTSFVAPGSYVLLPLVVLFLYGVVPDFVQAFAFS